MSALSKFCQQLRDNDVTTIKLVLAHTPHHQKPQHDSMHLVSKCGKKKRKKEKKKN
jgi:hypothetical protein